MEKNQISNIREKLKIGQLLVNHTDLTEGQLNEALEEQKESKELLGQILLRKNYINGDDITKVICHQLNIPFTDTINVEDIDPNIVLDLPINYAKKHKIVPMIETDFSVTIAMGDPLNYAVVNDLSGIFKKEIQVVISSEKNIELAINRVYEKANRNLVDTIEDQYEDDLDLDGPIDILDAGADEAPVIRFVNSIIFRAVKERASDIHIEPYEKDVVYRFRINRVMTEILRQPKKTHSAVSSRIKVMAKLDIAEKRLPQDGRIKIKIAGKDIDIRLSTVPIQNGERIVMRVLEKTNTVLDLESLGFTGSILKGLQDFSTRKHGVLYVTGPTGHGKTTTLFAVLDRMNSPDKMIITVEDPVEYEISGISQIQVNSKINLSFAIALRAILRQNPDIVMVGETRDQETADMAIQASLTGHFVLSTLHTNDACSAPTRLIDMGVQPFLISSSLVGVLAQRLVRTLCKKCREPSDFTDEELVLLDINREDIPKNSRIFKPIGCEHCNYSGYDSMTVVAELLSITDRIRGLIIQKSDASVIRRAAQEEGMKTLRISALEKVLTGVTSVEEIMRAIIADGQEEG
ncbi:type II secretion system ATPase GspE [Bacteriovoracaceae bacterium]|nr:type II secretion system ATPase GspE [Bacteriovoracaceae bacterium]